MSSAEGSLRNVKKVHDLSKFQAVLRQKCQQQMRERRNQLFNRGRSGLSSQDVQEALTEIVRQEFHKLTTTDKRETPVAIINAPLSLDEALREECEIIAEQEQWIMQEYERLMNCEEQMFDKLEDEAICPMCQRSFLEEIPDFIVCHLCGLKLKTEISLTKFKYNLEECINAHSQKCIQVPNFSLVFNDNNTSLCVTCSMCCSYYLIDTAIESQ